jgi:hypothetical protein
MDFQPIGICRQPAPPLSQFVEMCWLFGGHAPAHAKERVLPTGTMEFVVNLDENESRIYDHENPELCRKLDGAIVCGAHSRYFVIDTAEQAQALLPHPGLNSGEVVVGKIGDDLRVCGIEHELEKLARNLGLNSSL